jgi:uncharacterized membrane protein
MTIMNVLHVVGAVFIVGPMALLPMAALRALRGDSPSEVALLTKSTYLFSLLSLIVAVLGFGVMGMSAPRHHYTVATPWILSSIILYAVALLLSLFQVVPALRRATAQLEVSSTSAQATTAVSKDGYAAIAAGSGTVALLLVVVVVLMDWKP